MSYNWKGEFMQPFTDHMGYWWPLCNFFIFVRKANLQCFIPFLVHSMSRLYYVSLFNFSFLGFPTFLTLPFQKGRVRKTITTFLTLPFQKGRVRKTVTARKVKQRHKTAFLSRFHQKVEEIHFKLEKTVKNRYSWLIWSTRFARISKRHS